MSINFYSWLFHQIGDFLKARIQANASYSYVFDLSMLHRQTFVLCLCKCKCFSAILPKFNLLFQQFFQFTPTVELIYLSPYFNKPLNSLIAFLKLTILPYRGPNGTSFARTSFDQPLSALSILIVKLTTLAFRNPRGTTGAVLRVTFCCSHCLFSKKRGTLFF